MVVPSVSVVCHFTVFRFAGLASSVLAMLFSVSQAVLRGAHLRADALDQARPHEVHRQAVEEVEVHLKRGGGYCCLRYCCLELLDRELFV